MEKVISLKQGVDAARHDVSRGKEQEKKRGGGVNRLFLHTHTHTTCDAYQKVDRCVMEEDRQVVRQEACR